MFILKKTLFCIFLMLSSQIVKSEDLGDLVESNLAYQNVSAFLATINTINLISVEDGVEGGCLPYPNKLKDAAEIGLRRNGFILNTNASNHKLPTVASIYITALGNKAKSVCFANIIIQVEMYREAKVEWAKEPADIYGDGQHTNITIYHVIGGGVVIGNSDHIQSTMEKYTKDAMDDLFLKVSRARDDIFDKFPSIKRGYEHQIALEKQYKEQGTK